MRTIRIEVNGDADVAVDGVSLSGREAAIRASEAEATTRLASEAESRAAAEMALGVAQGELAGLAKWAGALAQVRALGDHATDASLAAIVRGSASIEDRAEEAIRHDTPIEVIIAAVTHEANRQYCRSLGDYSQVPFSQAPGWQVASAIAGVRGIMSGAITKPEQSHESWMAQKVADGWVYGPTKDPVTKTHPLMVPYAQLTPAHKKKDRIFFSIATAMLAAE